MKKYYLFIIVVFCVFKSQGQVYHPMFGYHHTWYVDNISPLLMPRTQNDNLVYDVMDANGDTIINDKQYFKAKLYWDNYMYSYDTTLFFREDTTLQQVWILLNDSTKEKLLYDFSLNKGDSMYLDFDFQDSSMLYYTRTGWYHIDSTKTIAILSGQRKSLYLSNPQNQYNRLLFSHYPEQQWIEQVGSTIMPDYLQHDIDMDAYKWGYWWNFFYITLCSFNDSIRIYHNPAFNNAGYTYSDSDSCVLSHSAGIFNINDQHLDIKISPNPAEDIIIVNTGLLKSSSAEIKIFNATGTTMYYSKIVSTSTNIQLTINISDLPSGMYFVQLSTPEALGINRFVKY